MLSTNQFILVDITKERFCSEDSLAIEWLRFPLIVCVVFIHSFAGETYGIPINWGDFSGDDAFNLTMAFFSRVATHFAVPCFYFISGYLFFVNIRNYDLNMWKGKLKSRVKTLLVPYILWNLLFIAFTLGKSLLKCVLGMESFGELEAWYYEKGGLVGMFWNCNVWGESAVDWLGNPRRNSGPIDIPLWFLRDLIVVTALAPVVHWFVRRAGLVFVGLLGLAFVSKVWPIVDGFSITALFFFSMGAYMGEHKMSLSVIRRWEKPIYITTVILLIVTTYLGGPDTAIGNIAQPFYRTIGVFAALCIALRFHKCGHVKYPVLTRSVFFVYALHGLHTISYYFGGIYNKMVADTNAFLMTTVYLLVPFLKIAACIVVFVLMERYTPRLLAMMTGSRNKKNN